MGISRSKKVNEDKPTKPAIIDFDKVIVFLIGIVGLIIIWPFVTALILAAVTAYTFYPLVSFLQKYLRSYNLAICVTLLLVVAPIAWSISYIAGGLTSVISTMQKFSSNITGALIKISEYLTSINLKIPGSQSVIAAAKSMINDFITKSQQSLISWIKNLPALLVSTLVYIFATYYFLRDGKSLKETVLRWSKKFDTEERNVIESIVRGLDNSFRVLFVSYIGISTIVGVMSAAIYYAFHIPYAGVLAVLTWLFAFLPVLSAPMVYVPVAAYMFYMGAIQQAIGVAVSGVLFLSLVPDLVLRPLLCGKAGNVHPLTIVLGFFGGPIVFGLKGFLIGPLLLVIVETVIKEYLNA